METPSNKLYRSRHDRIIAGVCGGLAKHFDLDPVIVRVLFVLLFLAKGASLLVYIVLMIVIPEEPGPEVEIHRNEKAKEFVREVGEKIRSVVGGDAAGSQKPFDTRTMFALIIIFVGLLLLVQQFTPFVWLQWRFIWPALIIVMGVLLIFNHKEK